MVIDEFTLYTTLAPIEKHLTKESVQELQKAAPVAVFGRDGYYSLTIEQLNLLYHNEVAEIVPNVEDTNKLTVFEYYTLLGLKGFIDEYVKALNACNVQLTADEERAAQAAGNMQFIEGLLCFAREYFGLHSFADAGRTTLGDLLIAKKDTYRRTIYQRAYNNILRNKRARK